MVTQKTRGVEMETLDVGNVGSTWSCNFLLFYIEKYAEVQRQCFENFN